MLSVSRASNLSAALAVLAFATARAATDQPATRDSSADTDKLQEVTVTAQHSKLDWAERNELVQKAATFVFGIAAVQNYDDRPPIWFAPVCPLVMGLRREQNEFVLSRVSEIARAAGARLGGEKCHPNLLIFVTAQPTDLLRAMEKQHFGVSFGNATQSEVDAFIDTPRPVRVWHNVYQARSSMAISGSRNSTVQGGLGLVYVVVDRMRLHGISQGQFADYVGMVSLAEIKSMPHFGDTQTILRLFDGSPQAAPEGLSDWDQEFLKILYDPQPSLANPRANTALRMIRELVP